MMKNLTRFLVLGVVLSFGVTVKAQLQKAQANYIYNFTRFLEWPESHRNGDFVICVLGKNHALTAELTTSAAQRTVGSQSIKVVEAQSVDAIPQCHIVFIPGERSSSLKKVHDKFGASPTIIITEEQDWNPSEASINFMVVDSKLAFKVNAKEINTKKLKVSDKLLALSK